MPDWNRHATDHATGGDDVLLPADIGAATAGHTHEGGAHPDLATHDTLGLVTQAELDAHAAAVDPHTGYRLESVALTDADVAAANKDGVAGTASLRTIGAGGQQAAAGNHTHPGGSEAFPVGAVFLSVVNTNPGTLLGYGTWSQIAGGKFLVGQAAADADFDVAEETGGAKTHTHAGHPNHASQGAHTHDAHTQGRKGGTTNPQDIFNAPVTHASQGDHTHDAHSAHDSPSHLPPYFVIYAWKRTA